MAARMNDAITDVAGVRVGHCTVLRDPDVRTGVTVVVPPDLPLFAGSHVLNGNGEVTGLAWVRESGQLTTPIGLTNTHSVGVVRDALVEETIRNGSDLWALPVVGETYDGFLNDINGMHVTREHVFAALADAKDGPVAQGCVGSGTGMICHGFKGGIGTASRTAGDYTVGVLVQANHGRRARLMIQGDNVGARSTVPMPESAPEGAGSIIVVVATDAPLLPYQCNRVAQRAALGVARTGGAGENSSGDFMLCFATGNAKVAELDTVRKLRDSEIDEIFYAAIDATEGAIVNALLHAETTTGRGGRTVYAFRSE
jgi:D-aminopeptidase